MISSSPVTVATDAGMLALWCAAAFDGVNGYADWEERVNDRLGDAVERGELVPLGIRADGAFGVRLVVAPDGASDRESRWAAVTSEPYLLVVSGGLVCISGLEWVGSPESAPIRANLPDGRYAVRCTLVAWDEEAAAHGLDGPPGEDALPDFLVLVEPAEAEADFRTDVVTFDPPGV